MRLRTERVLSTVEIKNRTSKIMTVVVLKLITLVLQCSDAAKSADGMANSAEPDQTAPSGAVLSGSTPFAIIQLSQYLEFLR